ATNLWMIQLLDGREERVHVDVEDGAGLGHGDIVRAERRAGINVAWASRPRFKKSGSSRTCTGETPMPRVRVFPPRSRARSCRRFGRNACEAAARASGGR